MKLSILFLTLTFLSFGQELIIPTDFQDWMYNERHVNDKINDTSLFSPIDINSKILPDIWNPEKGALFDIGYIEVPAGKIRSIYGSNLTAKGKALVSFVKNGKNYIRYFIHPAMEERLSSIINQHGGIIKGSDQGNPLGPRIHLGGAPTSSPRSLLVWDVNKPENVFGLKLSLGLSIGETSRLNDWDKLARSNTINEIFESITKSKKEKYSFDFFPESYQQETPGKQYGNILREFPLSMKRGELDLLPGFSLVSNREDGKNPALVNMINKSRMAPDKFIVEKILRPLLKAYAYLVFEEGLLGEPHQQNVLFEIGKNKLPTGKVFIRDMDAFRPDIQIRALKNKDLSAFLKDKRPFKTLKLAQALEFMDDSYGDYIRNDWAFLLETFLKKNKKLLKKDFEQKNYINGHKIWADLDKVFLQEAVEIIGAPIVFEEAHENQFFSRNRARLESLFPHVDDWEKIPDLSSEEVGLMIDEFGLLEIFFITVNDHKSHPFYAQKIVDNYKMSMSLPEKEVSQSLLKSEYLRLVYNYRASTRTKLPKNPRFHLVKGGIMVTTPSGKIHSTALLEPANAKSNYYKNVPYPRKAPGKNTQKLLNVLNSKKSCLKSFSKM